MVGRFTQSIIVGLVQINQPLNHGRFFLPYSAGILETYVRHHTTDPTRYMFLPPLYRKIAFKKALQDLFYADIVGFSTYTWNNQYSLALAALLKKQNPNILIIFGGPQVPDQAEEFLKQYPFVDLCCHGEGERIFLNILEAYPDNHWEDIPSISYINREGQFETHPKIKRFTDINQIPSPYLTDVFKPLLKLHPRQSWSALWETNRGCPFSCTFCDWGSAVNSKVYRFDEDRLLGEIKWFAENKIDTVLSCDANFGILKRDLDITQAIIQSKQQTAFPNTFVMQTTKNMTDRAYQVAKQLYEADLNQFVTLSLQSVHLETLKHIKRDNISLDTYRELQTRFQKDNVQTYTDLLIGLPGETYDSFANGISQLIQEGQYHLIQFYNVYLLPNAEMASPAYREQYQIKTVTVPYVFSLTKAPNGELLPYETQEMIISTYSAPSEDWINMRVMSWYTNLLALHRKVLQIPFIFLHKLLGFTYRELFEAYMNTKTPELPLLDDIQSYMFTTAWNIVLKNGPSFSQTTLPQSSNPIWLEPFDYVMTGLLETKMIEQFYQQNEVFLTNFLKANQKTLPPGLLQEALLVNKALFLSQMGDFTFEIQVNYNIWEFYQAVLKGQDLPLTHSPSIYYKDWPGLSNFQIKQRNIAVSRTG